MKSKTINNSFIAAAPVLEDIDVAQILDLYQRGELDIICILGATASGKTHYAVQFAKEINRLLGKESAEIISADSRQVYRNMDIGSGKDLEEYEDIPYHLIDIRDAGYRYNIYEYEQDFKQVYSMLKSQSKIAILCGGSGLYIRAAIESYFAKDKGLKAYYIGLYLDRDERLRRIDTRLKYRLEHSMIEEVRSLLESGVSEDSLLHYGLEYRYVTDYIMGRLTYSQLYDTLSIAIHQFSKRQLTWFRGMERAGIKIHWTSP